MSWLTVVVVCRYRAIMWPLKSHSSKSRTKVTILTINTVQYSTVQCNTLQVTILIIWVVATLLAVPLAVAFRAEVSTVPYSDVQGRLDGLLFCSRKLFSIRYRNILWVVSSLAFVYLNLYLVQQSPVPPSHHFPELDTQ